MRSTMYPPKQVDNGPPQKKGNQQNSIKKEPAEMATCYTFCVMILLSLHQDI